jgi:hypothetical protein
MLSYEEKLKDFCDRWQMTREEAREAYGGLLHFLVRADPLKLSEFKARRLLGDETVDACKEEPAWYGPTGTTSPSSTTTTTTTTTGSGGNNKVTSYQGVTNKSPHTQDGLARSPLEREGGRL